MPEWAARFEYAGVPEGVFAEAGDMVEAEHSGAFSLDQFLQHRLPLVRQCPEIPAIEVEHCKSDESGLPLREQQISEVRQNREKRCHFARRVRLGRPGCAPGRGNHQSSIRR
jgi:hypothetical protein